MNGLQTMMMMAMWGMADNNDVGNGRQGSHQMTMMMWGTDDKAGQTAHGR